MASAPLLNLNCVAPHTTIRTATGDAKTSVATAQLALPTLPNVAAHTRHVIPGFTNSLISLGKLCDAGCTAFLDRQHLKVHDSRGNNILTGTREPTGPRLWRVSIAPSPAPEVHVATPGPPSLAHIKPSNYMRDSTHPHIIPSDGMRDSTHIIPSDDMRASTHPPGNPRPAPLPLATSTRTTAHSRAYDLPSVPALIAYLHAAAGYPVKSMWLAAVKRGAYYSWPGLTANLVARYCPDLSKSHQGHMAQPRQHIRSTRLPIPVDRPRPQSTLAPPQPQSTFELHELPLTHLFMDDTGRFKPRSLSGNQYIMVGLHTASNAILVRAFASKHDSHRIPAYNDIFSCLKAVGAMPTHHVMDNEASIAFQCAIASNNCKLQLVPPHVHQQSIRSIQT